MQPTTMAAGRGGRSHNRGSQTCEGRGNGHGSPNQGRIHRNTTDNRTMGQENNTEIANDSDTPSMDNSMDRQHQGNYYSTLILFSEVFLKRQTEKLGNSRSFFERRAKPEQPRVLLYYF